MYGRTSKPQEGFTCKDSHAKCFKTTNPRRTEISKYTTLPMNALVTALPGPVIIFVLVGGVNALAGVLLLRKFVSLSCNVCMFVYFLKYV